MRTLEEQHVLPDDRRTLGRGSEEDEHGRLAASLVGGRKRENHAGSVVASCSVTVCSQSGRGPPARPGSIVPV